MDSTGSFKAALHLETEEIEPPKRIAHDLKVGPLDTVFVLWRLRLVYEEPLTLMVNYLPSRLVPGFLEKAARRESLYETLVKEYDLVATRAVDMVEARLATDEEAKRLRIDPWAPLLCVTRASYLLDGRPLEVELAISRRDRCQYRVEPHGRARRNSLDNS